ncbi:MAG TPA: helix-turn-helix domain-containing protein [Acidimicrobiales bacterium]|nr:helix-turn-helix domain-containing protein [Acidimicrobiales bacterium]
MDEDQAELGDGRPWQELWPQAAELCPILEDLGLASYEARVLIALARAGEATAAQLGELSGISRPNVYAPLESLEAKGLAERRTGKVARWGAPPMADIIGRLQATQEQRLKDQLSRVETLAGEAARRFAAGLAADAPRTGNAHVQFAVDDIQLGLFYERLITEATTEVLVCNRGPYPGEMIVSPEVIDALARGVKARALYRSAELEGEQAEALRRTAEAYQDAGVEARIVDDLPLVAAIFDGRFVLLGLPDPADPDALSVTDLMVDHPAFAAWCKAAFEQLWASAKPYRPRASGQISRSSSKESSSAI